MNSKKAHLFIDGSNTYHRLKDNGLYDHFTFEWLLGELKKEFNVEKIFYYDAIKSINIEPVGYSKQQEFHERLRKEMPGINIRQRKLKYTLIDGRVEKAKKKFRFTPDENKRLEEFLKEAGLRRLSKEKGIDIMMVVDMVKGTFQKKYDVALVLTGDADFVPAVELIQLLGNEVVNVHCYAGSAGELRNKCDSHIQIDIDAKFNCFLKHH